MTELSMGPHPLINFDALDAELKAALPGKLDGISWDKRANLTVIVREGQNTESLRPQIAAVIAAHNPAVLTAEQQEAAAQQAARTTLSQSDFMAWRTNVQNATTLAAMKVLVLQLGRVVWMLAKANGLTSTTDPGE